MLSVRDYQESYVVGVIVRGAMSENTENTVAKEEAGRVVGTDLSVNDRVRRVSGIGPFGTVEEVREEINTSATDRPKAKKFLVRVRCDSGTVSYFAPESLQIKI